MKKPAPKYPPLTPEQQAHVAANIGLAIKCTRMYIQRRQTRNVMDTDEFQWACYGLAEAAQRYNPTKKVQFSTYAFYWMRMRIFRCKAASTSGYTSKYWRPTMPISAMRGLVRGEVTFQDNLFGHEPEPIDELIEKERLRSDSDLDRAVRDCLRFMPGRMRRCVERVKVDGASLNEVGREEGLTRERIRQIMNVGLERIRARLHRMGVRNKGDLARILRGDVCLSS